MYLRVKYTEMADGIHICRVYGYEECLVLPDEIEGKPVTVLNPYALAYSEPSSYPKDMKEIVLNEEEKGFSQDRPLCGEFLKEVVLPRYMTTIGNYGFYYCRNMHTLHVRSNLKDIGGGAFMWCRSLKKLIFQEVSWDRHGIHEMLSEFTQELETQIQFDNGIYVRLTFPEYYEEVVENTPARILGTHWHGSGYKYRQSFPNYHLDTGYYDKLFPYAVANEYESTCTHLSINRLMTPYGLSEEAKEQYLTYLREHAENILKESIKEDDMDQIQFLAEQGLLTKELIEMAITFASQLERAQIGSYLMDYRREHFQTRRKKFEL